MSWPAVVALIAVRDMQGGPLGSCRASLGVSSYNLLYCIVALLADHSGSIVACLHGCHGYVVV